MSSHTNAFESVELFIEAPGQSVWTVPLGATHLNVCEILVNTGAFRDAVALVEVERRSKRVFAEPHLGKGVEETLVVVVSHTATILNLSDHVSHCGP